MFIPEDYCLASFVHMESGDDVGTEPYVWTQGYLVGTSPDYQEIADTIAAAWGAHLSEVTSDSIALDRVNLTVPAPGGGTGVVSSTLPPIPGTDTAAASYSVFAPKVRKITARPGRKGRGVCHPPGMLHSGEVGDNGSVTSGARTRIANAMNDFGTELGGLLILGVLLHTNEADGDPDPITGISVAGTAGILRKRMA